MIRDIECGIIDFYASWSHAFLVPHVGDFLGRALFDADIRTGGGVHVDGGGGSADVEGDAVVFGEDGDARCADLVGDVAVGGDTIAADEDAVDPAVLHDGCCHVVADEGDIHACSAEFICGETCALQEGARLVGVDFEVVAFLMTEIHDGGCCAVFGCGELARVAVCEEAVAGLYEGERMLSYFFADFDVFLLDAQGFVTEKAADLGDGFALCIFDDVLHAVQRPREIDSSGAGGVEVVGSFVKLAREFAVVIGVNLERGEVDADRGGIPNGGGAAHLQLTDCRPDFALRFEMAVFGSVREFGLVDDDEGTLLFVEGEGLHVEDVCVHCGPLFVK